MSDSAFTTFSGITQHFPADSDVINSSTSISSNSVNNVISSDEFFIHDLANQALQEEEENSDNQSENDEEDDNDGKIQQEQVQAKINESSNSNPITANKKQKTNINSSTSHDNNTDISNLPLSTVELNDHAELNQFFSSPLYLQSSTQVRARKGHKRMARALNNHHSKLTLQQEKKLGDANQKYIAGDKIEAIKIIKEIIRINPHAPGPFHTLGLIYEEDQDYEKCIQCYICAAHNTSKASANQTDIETWFRVGKMAYDIQQYKQALFCFNKVIKKDIKVENLAARYHKGLILVHFGEYGKAIDHFNIILQNNPSEALENSQLVRDLAMAYYNTHQTNKAKTLLENFLQNQIKNFAQSTHDDNNNNDNDTNEINHTESIDMTCLNMYCDSLKDTENYEKLYTFITQVEPLISERLPIEIRCKFAVAAIHLQYNNGNYIGNNYSGLINTNIIDSILSDLSLLNVQDYHDLYWEIAEALLETGQIDQAAALYNQLTVVESVNNVTLLLRRAYCIRYSETNPNLVGAAELYEQILEQDNNNREIKLALSEIYREMGLHDKALELIQDVTQTNSNKTRKPRTRKTNDINNSSNNDSKENDNDVNIENDTAFEVKFFSDNINDYKNSSSVMEEDLAIDEENENIVVEPHNVIRTETDLRYVIQQSWLFIQDHAGYLREIVPKVEATIYSASGYQTEQLPALESLEINNIDSSNNIPTSTSAIPLTNTTSNISNNDSVITSKKSSKRKNFVVPPSYEARRTIMQPSFLALAEETMKVLLIAFQASPTVKKRVVKLVKHIRETCHWCVHSNNAIIPPNYDTIMMTFRLLSIELNVDLKRWNAAFEDVHLALVNRPMNWQLGQLTNIIFNNLRWDRRCVRILERIHDKFPHSPVISLLLAHHYYQSQSFEFAYQAYLRVYQMIPNYRYIELFLGLSKLQVVLKRNLHASDPNSNIEDNSNNNISINNLNSSNNLAYDESGEITNTRGHEFLSAFTLLYKYLAKMRETYNPSLIAEGYYNMARAFHYLNLLHFAIHYYEQVLKLDCKGIENNEPDYKCESAHNLSIIYLNSGNKELAKRLYEQYVVI